MVAWRDLFWSNVGLFSELPMKKTVGRYCSNRRRRWFKLIDNFRDWTPRKNSGLLVSKEYIASAAWAVGCFSPPTSVILIGTARSFKWTTRPSASCRRRRRCVLNHRDLSMCYARMEIDNIFSQQAQVGDGQFASSSALRDCVARFGQAMSNLFNDLASSTALSRRHIIRLHPSAAIYSGSKAASAAASSATAPYWQRIANEHPFFFLLLRFLLLLLLLLLVFVLSVATVRPCTDALLIQALGLCVLVRLIVQRCNSRRQLSQLRYSIQLYYCPLHLIFETNFTLIESVYLAPFESGSKVRGEGERSACTAYVAPDHKIAPIVSRGKCVRFVNWAKIFQVPDLHLREMSYLKRNCQHRIAVRLL